MLISFESYLLATYLASINRTSYLKVMVEITCRVTRLLKVQHPIAVELCYDDIKFDIGMNVIAAKDMHTGQALCDT